MKRPESREFLFRSKISVSNQNQNLQASQSFNPSSLNRSYSNSRDKSNGFIRERNTTGYVHAQMPAYQRPPIDYRRRQNGQSCHQYQLNGNEPPVIEMNKQNVTSSSNSMITELIKNLNVLTQRMNKLETNQKSQQQRVYEKLKQRFLQQNINHRLSRMEQKQTEHFTLIQALSQQVRENKLMVNTFETGKIRKQVEQRIQQMTEVNNKLFNSLSKEFGVFKQESNRKFKEILQNLKQRTVKSIKKDNKPIIALFDISVKILSGSGKKQKGMEEMHEIYKIDQDGFLIDQEGSYLLDSRNYMIRIDKEMLKKLESLGLIKQS